jgi:hypothetical protein
MCPSLSFGEQLDKLHRSSIFAEACLRRGVIDRDPHSTANGKGRPLAPGFNQSLYKLVRDEISGSWRRLRDHILPAGQHRRT